VLLEIYGLTVVDQMVPIQGEIREDEPEYPRVTGYVSRPTCYKSTRQHLSFFVNRRWVLSRMLNAAVEEAYHSLLLSGRHPIAIVNIEVDPAHIDVNVHPAKTEIRFLKERRIYAALMRATRKAVLEEAEIPTWGQRGPASSQPAPAQSSPATKNLTNDWSLPAANRPTPDRQAEPANMNEDTLEGDPELDAILNAPIEPASIQAEQALPLNQQDTRAIQNQFPRDNPWLTVTEEENGTRPPMQSRLWQSHIRAEASTRTGQRSGPLSNNPVTETPQPVTDAPQPETPSFESQTTAVRPEEPVEIFSLPETHSPTSFMPDPTMRKLPPLRVIGQLSQSFIVTEGPDGMFLIDQHAAHERILLERMVASLQARTPLSQLLLTPIELELTPGEVGAIEDHMSQLEQIGFTFKLHDNNYLETHAIPNVLMKQINALSLREILADLTAPESLGHAETWEEHALANVACKAAIKANYFLTVSEMREMIEQLEGTKAPFSCCHGRPTMVHFSRSALENEFGRR
ncbi:MAG TPA: DNA mismatch repair endonuclease MutL, partial [Ktedonobacteraceae bacterium]|nr:DNA mismatch repair endonuclease MutL [Ktedonobacteraceae bacterium]